MTFKDHFSRQASDYAKFRPSYPRALFAFVAAQSPADMPALDCATGNGQAALGLAEFFPKVIALDASTDQIANAQSNDRIEYRIAPAEATGLPDGSCAAITVAQAMHWLDLERFYAEAGRVLVSGGVLAFWAYNYLRINPGVEAVLRHYHDEVVGPYWPPERKLVGRGYLDLPFPFEEIAHPEFEIETRWTFDHLIGYLRSWSATQRFAGARGTDPLDLIADDLGKAWGDPAQEYRAVWPLILRIGRA